MIGHSQIDMHPLWIGNSIVDSGFLADVGVDTFMCYLALRRYVWRSNEGPLSKMYKDGFLVSCIGQPKLATLLGVSERKVASLIATLKEWRWIQIIPNMGYRAYYVLGRTAKSTVEGINGEGYFATPDIERRIEEGLARIADAKESAVVELSSKIEDWPVK